MQIKAIALFLCSFFLFGCQGYHKALLHSPKPEFLNGRWEGTGFLPLIEYVTIQFDLNGNATILAAGGDEKLDKIGELSDFETHEHTFKTTLHMYDEDEKMIFDVVGEIRYKQMCLWVVEENEKEDIGCYLMIEDINEYRRQADELIQNSID